MPSIDLAAFRKQVQAGRLAMVYLLYGEDVRLIEQQVDAIEATVEPADRPFAVERLYAGESHGSPVDIAASANVFPMLGSRRIVSVLRAERFLKPARNVKSGEAAEALEAEGEGADAEETGGFDLTPLESYVDRPSPSTTLIFVATGVDKSRRLTKRLLEKAVCLELGGLGGNSAEAKRDARRDVIDQIQREIMAAGRTIEPAGAQLLVDRAGGDISKLRGDVERLLLFTEGQKKISRSDVDEVVSVETDIDDWAVVNAIGDGDVARALKETGFRFERGDSPHQLMGQLRWWVSQQLARSAPDRAKPAIDALFRTDLALKRSGGDPRVLVERLVVELTGRPVPRPGWR